jgi:hypothetical protein
MFGYAERQGDEGAFLTAETVGQAIGKYTTTDAGPDDNDVNVVAQVDVG